MYRLLIDQRNMPGGLRGYSLYFLNKEGVFTAYCTDEDACIGCAMCAMMCPDCAIIVED